MKVLIKQATIVCSASPHHGTVQDILVADGIIHSIAASITAEADQVIAQPGVHVSIGWMDVFAHFCDPGYEFRETLESGARAAAAGGFTDLLLVPNTKPVVHDKAGVEYLVQKSKSLPVTIHPMGAVTKNAAGAELAEMYDMRAAGALAFGDGIHPIQNSGLLIKALQYVKAFDGTIVQVPDDASIAPSGLVNEGIVSTRLGLPGKPLIAEELVVARDIKLARYAGSRLHFTGISSPKSIEYIQRAREAGLPVSCSVTPYHLFFADEALSSYDTNLKVTPPIREASQRAALLQAFLAGKVDCLASHHLPQHSDHKLCEFEYAKPGMITLESLFGVIWSLVNKDWPIETLVEKLTIAPRQIFGVPVPVITEGAEACLTLFDPAAEYRFTGEMIFSRSANSAFTGQTLKGRVLGIVHHNQVVLNS